MQVHEFYGKYGNTKIPARLVPLAVTEKVKRYNDGLPLPAMITLSDIYHEVDRLEQLMHPLKLRQETLIDMAKDHMRENQA